MREKNGSEPEGSEDVGEEDTVGNLYKTAAFRLCIIGVYEKGVLVISGQGCVGGAELWCNRAGLY